MTLKELRKEKSIKQIQIVRLLNISSGCISQWETGKRLPPIEQLPNLANILDCSISELVLAIIETKETANAKVN